MNKGTFCHLCYFKMRTRWFLSTIIKGNQMWLVAILQEDHSWISKHTCWWSTAFTSIHMGMKPWTEERGAAFSHCLWFYSVWISCRVLVMHSLSSFQERSSSSPGLRWDGRSSGGVRKSVLQLWSDQTATNCSSRRDVWTWAHKGFASLCFSLLLFWAFLWTSTKLPPFWNHT